TSFFFYTSAHPRHLHSFPTRRSSDLGDPSVFPDQIKSGLKAWSPLKVYARVPFFLEPGNMSPKGVYDYATHHYAPAGVYNYVLKIGRGTRLNSSHDQISYAVFCLKKK